MNLELENRLNQLRRETESLFRENRRQRLIGNVRLSRLKNLIAETIQAQRGAACQKMEIKAWLEDWTAKSRSKF